MSTAATCLLILASMIACIIGILAILSVDTFPPDDETTQKEDADEAP